MKLATKAETIKNLTPEELEKRNEQLEKAKLNRQEKNRQVKNSYGTMFKVVLKHVPFCLFYSVLRLSVQPNKPGLTYATIQSELMSFLTDQMTHSHHFYLGPLPKRNSPKQRRQRRTPQRIPKTTNHPRKPMGRMQLMVRRRRSTSPRVSTSVNQRRPRNQRISAIK